MIETQINLVDYISARYNYQRAGGGILIRCPFHDDRVESMYITEDYAYCFSCAKGWNTKQMIERLDPGASVQAVPYKEKAKKIYHPPRPELVRVAHRTLNAMPEKIKYLTESRGLTRSILEKYKVGYTRPPMQSCTLPRYTFPAWDETGKLVSISYRKDPKLQYPDVHPENKKYLTHPGTSVILYNMHMIPKYDWFIYVGGQIDALSLLQYDIPAVGVMGEGIFRNEWSCVVGDKKVFILLDNDKAGEHGSERVASLIRNPVIIRWPEGLEKKYDVNEAITSPVFGINRLASLLRSHGASI